MTTIASLLHHTPKGVHSSDMLAVTIQYVLASPDLSPTMLPLGNTTNASSQTKTLSALARTAMSKLEPTYLPSTTYTVVVL